MFCGHAVPMQIEHPLSCKSSMEKPCVVNTTCITLHICMIIPGVMLYCYPRKSSHGGCIITSALDTHNLELANHEFVQRPWTNRRHTLHSSVATVESHGCSFKLASQEFITWHSIHMYASFSSWCWSACMGNNTLSIQPTTVWVIPCLIISVVWLLCMWHIIYSLSLGLNQNVFPFW